VSDTQHDEIVDLEAEREQERREARERAYQDVSLRAVELLASAQRAADEAVAEAQSYARDLEETAREQYQHILQRAHDAARAASPQATDDGGSEVSGEAGDVDSGSAPADPGSGLEARELEYVRTYARVAHTQLRAVLGALNDELDRLAGLADGIAPSSDEVRDASGGSQEQPEASHDGHDSRHAGGATPDDDGPHEHYGDGHHEHDA